MAGIIITTTAAGGKKEEFYSESKNDSDGNVSKSIGWHKVPASVSTKNGFHQAGVSVKNKTIPEDGMDAEDYEDHIVYWPGYEYISDE